MVLNSTIPVLIPARFAVVSRYTGIWYIGIGSPNCNGPHRNHTGPHRARNDWLFRFNNCSEEN